MAMIDYGAIAFKNGKLISTEMFTPMIDMVGWEDTDDDVYESHPPSIEEPKSNYMKPLKLKNNYFAYIGDSDCTLAFYKCELVIAERYADGTFRYCDEWFNCTNYTWSKWEKYAGINLAKVKVTKRNGYFVCKWEYQGDKYKVYFGYGVDVDLYKKWHIVNAYRTPSFLFRKTVRFFKDKIHDWRYR